VVAQFLELKLRLLGNAFRRSTWQVIGLVIGLLYGIGISIAVVGSLGALRLASVSIATSSVTVFGSLLVLGFLVVPLVFGLDDSMDPRKFSLFGIPTTRLAGGLAVAALASIPSIVVACIAIAQVVTWSRGPLPVLLSLIGVVVIIATCVLGARVTTSIAALLLSTRRSRDATGVLGILLLILLAPVFLLLLDVDWQRSGGDALAGVASVFGWTPLGAVWAAPGAAASGDAGGALLRELMAIVFLGVLWVAWRALVGLLLVTPQRESREKSYNGLGFFGVVPSTPTWAIVARSFTYWVRDARYHVSLLIIPLIPLVLIIPLSVVGVPSTALALLPVPVIAVFLGWAVHNDVAYDNTAIWLHVASATRGSADRLGRAIPVIIVGTPVIIVASLFCAPLYGREGVLPVLIGVGLCILFSGLGLTSIMSARFPYPAVRPGDSPFAQPQAAGTASTFIQSFSFVATFALSLPTLIVAFMALTEGGRWNSLTLLVGIGEGVVLLAGGIAWGGFIFKRRAPELLAFSVRN
jgi:ABC-2 type transport system permease protein